MDGECVPTDIDAGADAGIDESPDAGPSMDGGGGCASSVFCGSPPVCCPSGSECVDDACLPACASGVRCGADATTCCAEDQVCISQSCVDPGAPCTDSFDCPSDTFCEPTLGRCLPQFDPVTCESTPVFGAFETTLERSMTTSMVRPDCFHAISAATVIDLDRDGVPEIVANMACDEGGWARGIVRAFRGDTGAELWVTDFVETHGRISTGAADLRGDGTIAIVTLTSPLGPDPRRAIALSATGAELWRSTMADGTTPLRIDGANGAPSFADFDGDGLPEIGVAGAGSYSVYDPDGAMPVLWSRPTQDVSSNATGSSVFDFEGDGSAEVVYQDECYIWVYAGSDGSVLLRLPNTSATIHEYPLVVDVDGDGNSEIVAVANDRAASIPTQCRATDPIWSGRRKGVFVYGDVRDQWMRTRRIWNQHAYHVTNVASDGTVPRLEPNNWETAGLNNYRQNVQGEGVFNAPDLEVAGLEAILEGCPERVTLRARVRNVGNLGAPAGVPVSFYRGPITAPGPLIGTVPTDVPLLPGASTAVTIEAPLEGDPPYTFHAVVDDDGSGAGVVAECNEGGNGEEIADVDCNLLI